jgi:hypothetical protein
MYPLPNLLFPPVKTINDRSKNVTVDASSRDVDEDAIISVTEDGSSLLFNHERRATLIAFSFSSTVASAGSEC